MRKASAGGSESPPHDPESSLSEDPGKSSSDDTYEAPPSRASYNLTKTPRFAMELVRSGTSTRAGASLGNALILDLRNCGLLSPDVNIELLMMDKNKISRQMDAAKIKSESILSTRLVLALTGEMTPIHYCIVRSRTAMGTGNFTFPKCGALCKVGDGIFRSCLRN